ncbi:MAG: glycoside hydrolase family 2, partial [Promicromonosporaceae bacterium]|nr:glycoside hydrolase family 2 [Promicromonosporaceae bacterium]
MTTLPLLDGWAYRRPIGPFEGADPGTSIPEAIPVRLPHDALRDVARTPDAPGRGAGAYYPNAAFTYVRTLAVPREWEGKVVRLEVQGAMRRAQVFLNNEFAGVRADGYARFFVDLTPYLLFGQDNTLRIEVRTGEDSRWYSGAGLIRPVYLHVDEPVHVAPDGVRVTTVRVEDDQAVVEVATTIANAGINTRTVDVATEIAGPDDGKV